MNRKEVLEALKKIKGQEKRKFTQTIDLIINLKNINLKEPKNRFNEVLELPSGKSKKSKICVVADGDALVQAKKMADVSIAKDDLPKWKDKKKIKKLADSVDFLIVQAQLMQPLATSLGQVLGPRGKMPTPAHIVPPVTDITTVVNRAKNSIRVRLKETPVIHTYVGSEEMDDEKLAENIEAVVKLVTKKLEKGTNSIKSIILKSTMGPVVKLNA
jgi:large subunit ribosomal protein L1